MALREATGQRLLATGPQLALARFQEAADIYLEGFPVGSPTALLEVGLLGIPCVRAPRDVPPPFAADGVALSGVRQPVDLADYVTAAIALVRNEGERGAQGSALARAIEAHHTQPRWPVYAQKAESALPDRHRVYSLAGAAPLSTHLRDLSVALSTLGHAEDTLTFTFRAAFELGLRVHVDAALAKALVTRCLFRDPRLLRRRWLLVALVGSIAGQRLALRAIGSERARP